MLLILAALAAGLWRWRSFSRSQPRNDFNVLLITIDTLRADAIGAYGNARAATPWIDRLAAGGVRFPDAHAHNVTTLPSHANIFSGKYPTDHGVRDNLGFRFPATIETLATRLKARGYRTGAFVSAFPLDSRFGLNRGFDVYDDRFVDAQTRPAFLEQERRGAETVALARRWIDGGAPYFCWVHIYEPHFPYEPPEPFASRFQSDLYLGEVAAADAALAPLVEPLIGEGRNGQTLVVLTADHGESLGQHGEATHGIFAYEATLRVPLIIFQPQLFQPRVAFEPARHVDLLPTILEVLSIHAPDGLAGRSLLSALKGASSETASKQPAYFEALSGNLNRGWAPLRGIIEGPWKYIDLPLPELYDLEHDPDEARNLAVSRAERIEHLRALLAAARTGERRIDRRVETAEARERLRGLGYTSGASDRSAAQYTDADDPKRLIELDGLLQEVTRLYLAGDVREALARCRELVRRRPTMTVSLIELAHLERASGNMPQAIEALQKANAFNPADTQTVSLLAAYLTQAGRAREAAEMVGPYLKRDDVDLQVVSAGALALASSGQRDEALSVLARARREHPSNAMLLVQTGTIHMMADDRDAARRDFEAALALNPDVARAHSSLGVIAAESGRTAEAIDHWKRAIGLDPQEVGKLLAFGEFLRRRGGDAKARPFLELFIASAPPNARDDVERVRKSLGQTR